MNFSTLTKMLIKLPSGKNFNLLEFGVSVQLLAVAETKFAELLVQQQLSSPQPLKILDCVFLKNAQEYK